MSKRQTCLCALCDEMCPFISAGGITCPFLLHPDNGLVSYSILVSSSIVEYGTIANFSCFSSFGLSGGEEVLFCDGDGTSLLGEWDGNVPECQRKLEHVHIRKPVLLQKVCPKKYVMQCLSLQQFNAKTFLTL